MKTFKVLVAAIAMAAVVTPAIASDLKLSGTMEVRGHYLNTDAEGVEATNSWNYQRLRTAGSYSVADGVSVNFRFDVTESDDDSSAGLPWGANGQYTQRRADIQYDLAYLQLVKNGVTFQAGELYSGRFGIGNLSDALGAGFKVAYAGATAFHIKQSESTSLSPTSDIIYTDTDETSLTGLAYTYKADGFSLTPMVAYTNVAGSDADILGAMLAFTADAGPVMLKGEIDMFDGEKDATVDYKGLQLYLDASVKATDTATVGAMLLWGDAQDGDDEEQITRLGGTGFGGWEFSQYGHNETDFTDNVTPFEIDDNAGMRAAQLYVNADVSADLNVMAAIGYAEADDDDISDMEATILNASAAYKFMPNTTLKFSANYIDAEEDGDDYEATQGIAGVYVSF